MKAYSANPPGFVAELPAQILVDGDNFVLKEAGQEECRQNKAGENKAKRKLEEREILQKRTCRGSDIGHCTGLGGDDRCQCRPGGDGVPGEKEIGEILLPVGEIVSDCE